jgi:AraC-like DNA-binding protein
MLYIAKAEIVVSFEVKDLYKSESLNQFIEGNHVVALSLADELFLNQLIDFTEREWRNNDLTVDDFNTHLGYSKSQLYRKMMALIGESPNNFLMSYRLDRSLTLLYKETGNISEIAFESGFSNPSYFSKCFHQKYGHSPSDYLRMKQN